MIRDGSAVISSSAHTPSPIFMSSCLFILFLFVFSALTWYGNTIFFILPSFLKYSYFLKEDLP